MLPGVVTEIGSEVTMFKPGDEVWYAGDLTRPGSNCEFHLVDERIAAKTKVVKFSRGCCITFNQFNSLGAFI